MLVTRHLVVEKKRGWGKYGCRLTTKTPSLKSNEVAVRLEIDLPDVLFERPQIEAKVTIPPDMVSPKTVEAEVLDNVETVLQQQAGLDVTVRLVEQEKTS